MTPEQFCYWLQGFGELNGSPPTKAQWQSINEHLQTTFKKITPSSPGQILGGGQVGRAIAGLHPAQLQC